MCTETAFLAAAAPHRGLPAPMVGYRKVTASSVWPSDMPRRPARHITTYWTTGWPSDHTKHDREHGRRRFVLCSQHTRKERAAELLREAQGGLRSG